MKKIYGIFILSLFYTSITYAQEGININILSGTNTTNAYYDDFGSFSSKKKMQSHDFIQLDTSPTDISQANKKEYLEKIYAPWDKSKISTNKDSIFYMVPMLQNTVAINQELRDLKAQNGEHNKTQIATLEQRLQMLLGVGENLMPNNPDDFKEILNNLNTEAFLHDPKIAIITRATSVRALPTHKPRYKNKEDFPFDRWQNSLIFEGTPITITHFSKDKKYAHVQAPFVYGWVDVRDIALVSNSLRNKLVNFENYKTPSKDLVPLYYNNQWILEARIGQIFPYNKRKNKLLTFYKDSDGYAQIREVAFPAESFVNFPLPLNQKNVSSLIHSTIGQKYGWGGLFGNRDCSAFTRDIFAPFGIFLPRNSAAQAQFKGRFIDLSAMDSKEKEQYIIENATPFGTIIWLQGHIMLYIGTKEINNMKRAIVAHSAWGVQPIINDKKENIQLGSTQITTMDIGGAFDSNAVVKNSLLSRIKGITHIYTEKENNVIDLSHFQVLH